MSFFKMKSESNPIAYIAQKLSHGQLEFSLNVFSLTKSKGRVNLVSRKGHYIQVVDRSQSWRLRMQRHLNESTKAI